MLRATYNGSVTLGVDQARYYATDWARGYPERDCRATEEVELQ